MTRPRRRTDRPPRVAEWLLALALPGGVVGASIRGDMNQEFAEIASSRPDGPPRGWYWREAFKLASWYAAMRVLRLLGFDGPQGRGSIPDGRNTVRMSVRNGFENLLQDVRFGIRVLVRNPGYAAVVIATLALGIGANTAVFSVVDGVLLAPLPYEDPGRLVRVYMVPNERSDLYLSGRAYVAGMGFLNYREQTDVFDDLVSAYTYRQTGADLTGSGEPAHVVTKHVSSGYFSALGVRPALGREFRLDEENRDARVALISHGLWQRRFGGDHEILGRRILLDGEPLTVIGVIPADFVAPVGAPTDVWLPENLVAGGRNSWGNFYLTVVGRLRPGVTLDQAHERLATLHANLSEENPRAGRWSARIVPLHEDTVGRSDTMLLVLMGAVGLVLLGACFNVANMSLARGAARTRELAVRVALGAARRRLATQLLVESLVLAALGGAGGVLLAWLGARALLALNPDALPRVDAATIGSLTLDGRVLLFTAVVSIGTGLLFGLLPAYRFSRSGIAGAMRDAERGASGGAGHQRLHSGLVVSQVAVAIVLLIGSGLLMKSFAALGRTALGIRPDNVVTYEVHLPSARYGEPEQRIAFYDDFFARVGSIPGVTAIGSISHLPTEGHYHEWGVRVLERAEAEDDDAWNLADVRVVDGDIFEVLGTPLVRGRLLDGRDRPDTARAALVNEAFVAATVGDDDPLGIHVTFGDDDDAWEVVGVVGDIAYDPRGSVSPVVYLPHRQFADDRNWSMIQAVSTPGAPESIVSQARAQLEDVDADLVLYRVRTLTGVVDARVAPERFTMVLMTVFASLALLLAAIGIYGVLSYMVSLRRREIGIRVALGAERSSVRALVVRRGLVLSAIGTVVGLAAAVGLTRLLSSLVYGVEVTDPGVFVTVAIVLLGVAWVAGFVPAGRATRVDPIITLREE